MPNSHYNKKLRENAHNLRRDMTKAEACLWKYALRAGLMNGYTFRRQRSIGWYIADFMCLELKLIIEVDGVTHLYEEVQLKDERKENYLAQQGYRVIRFTDEAVLREMGAVIEQLLCVMEEQEILLRPSGTSSKGGQPADTFEK